MFPMYAIYKRKDSTVFNEGEIIKLYSFYNISGTKYNKTYENSTVYKASEQLEEGYAEYVSLDNIRHCKVHITEIEAWSE